MRLLSLLPRILAIFLIALPPLIAIRQPALMQGCDFVMTFYPVGAMVAGGQASNIYPPPGATSFINAPFNLFAHSLLASLPKNYVAIYMYPPLVAAIFAPLSKLPPTAALVLWQILSVLSLVLIAALFAQRETGQTSRLFFHDGSVLSHFSYSLNRPSGHHHGSFAPGSGLFFVVAKKGNSGRMCLGISWFKTTVFAGGYACGRRSAFMQATESGDRTYTWPDRFCRKQLRGSWPRYIYFLAEQL